MKSVIRYVVANPWQTSFISKGGETIDLARARLFASHAAASRHRPHGWQVVRVAARVRLAANLPQPAELFPG